MDTKTGLIKTDTLAEKRDALREVRERKQKLRDAPDTFEPRWRKAKTLADQEAVTLPEA